MAIFKSNDVFKKNKSYLEHYGIIRRSGRYPWGSGEDPYQRTRDFRSSILDMKKNGMSESEIAKGLGITNRKGEGDVKSLRNAIALAKSQEDAYNVYQVNRMLDKKMSVNAIAERIGRNESTVRGWLDPRFQEKARILENTSNMLEDQINKKKMLDVSEGTELHAGVTRHTLDAALYDLEQKGYQSHLVPLQQVGTGKVTWTKVMSTPDIDYQQVRKNQADIKALTDWSEDGGESYQRLQPPKSIDSSRVLIKYAEDGGTDRDGMVQLRRGVEDLSLGDKSLAQVRIAVDGKYYMKGMAVYTDDIPKGIDVIYNSNKSKSVGPEGAFKKFETDDPLDPFGTSITQKKYIDKNGNEQLSAINNVGYSSKRVAGEEGYWDSWNSGKALASQFLSKQNTDLAKEQLDKAYNNQKSKFDEINSLTNAAVKQRLLDSYADDCDSKAVHLEGAAIPRQSAKVLISLPSLKENECYAPTYKDGESVVAVRYPHAGAFEAVKMTVNNKNQEGKLTLGNAIDAIGIHPKSGNKLSGADYDGDAVTVFPWSKKIKVEDSLEGLKNFDPKVYKYPTSITSDPSFSDPKSKVHKMTDREKGLEMGGVSNLITDMSLKGAPPDHITKAVRHSMVAIDAQKHNLDYKASARDNEIPMLKSLYQGGPRAGASTLLSRSTSEQRVPQTRALKKGEPGYETSVRRSDYSVDLATGKKLFGQVEPKAPFYNKAGQLVVPQVKKKVSSKMYETEDARSLISKTNPAPMEYVYADFANRMKSLGNDARKESASIKRFDVSPSAREAYKSEVESLDAKLRMSKRNAPLERQANFLGNSLVDAKKEANPNLNASQLRKIKGAAIEEARLRVGAGKQKIVPTEREWEAIQAKAVSHSKLKEILDNADMDAVVKLATPKSLASVSSGKVLRAKAMLARGNSVEEIAQALGISTSTVSRLKFE